MNFSCRGLKHGRHGNPRMPAVKGDIYYVYVPSLSPLMLVIGVTAIIIGEHWAR
jgi:hypothetical protein